MTKFENSLDFARKMDEQDELRKYRSQYHMPKMADGKEMIYFCGNSLGLMPKSVRERIEVELKDWETLGVEGHFHGRNPWFSYHHFLTEASARLVGAQPSEVVVMNSLTVNLHLMMASFYRPTKERYKILIESPAFPSDQYAVASQAAHHGFDPKEAIVEAVPREGEETLRTEDILAQIESLGDELALVMFGGVNYYTGQFFELEKIAKAAHDVGALAGFDLAHAAGNVELKLHDWEADFAVWCSYKYLNSGPGGTSGVFVHEKHGNDLSTPRFAGWWGNDEKSRFMMEKEFVPQAGAAGWQLSNAQILPMAAHCASLELFDEVGMAKLNEKSRQLTGYLEYLIQELDRERGGGAFQIITPSDVSQRGCQLSFFALKEGKALFDKLEEAGVIADWRKPNVIRVAPVPMYNSFEDVYQFVNILRANVN